MGVPMLDESFELPTSEMVLRAMAPHCRGPELQELIPKRTAPMEKYAPAGADLKSWRCG